MQSILIRYISIILIDLTIQFEQKGMKHITANTTWVHLQTLSLVDTSIGTEGAKHLATNTSWIHLQALDL